MSKGEPAGGSQPTSFSLLPVYIVLLDRSFSIPYIKVEVDHAGEAHQPGLDQNDDPDAGSEEIKEAKVLVGQSENGPVPEQVQEEEQHGERIVHSAPIVLFIFHALSAGGTAIDQGEAFGEGEDRAVDENVSFPAVGAFHGEQAAQKASFFDIDHEDVSFGTKIGSYVNRRSKNPAKGMVCKMKLIYYQ